MAVRVYIDGDLLDVPVINGIYALTGSVTRRLNGIGDATINVPMQYAEGGAGSLLKIEIDGYPNPAGGPAFHGFVKSVETDTSEDTGYSQYNAQDILELWQWRYVRDYDGLTPGNFIDPYILIDKQSGPQIVEAMALASENPSLIPTAAEGTLFIIYGEFETGGTNLSGAPANWPVKMWDMAQLLTSTGECDIVLNPIDSGGKLGELNSYNGDYGTDLSASVAFQYGFGDYNVANVKWSQDMSNISNKIQYFYGPKETTRRYKANTTGDDPCLDVQGALAVPDPWDLVELENRRTASRANYGVRMEIQEFDTMELIKELDHDPPGASCIELDPVKILYRQLWYMESWIRTNPRDIIHITPIRGVGVGDFDIGDLITVEAVAAVRGGFSGAQRVYEFTTSWDQEGVISIGEIQTSADQEGA